MVSSTFLAVSFVNNVFVNHHGQGWCQFGLQGKGHKVGKLGVARKYVPKRI